MGSGLRIELDSFLIRTAQHAKNHRQRQQERKVLKESSSRFRIPLFPVTAGNHHLQPQAEPEAEHINSQKTYSGKGRCAQFHITHMPQEQGISNVYQLFDKDAHHYRKSDEPNFLIGIIHLFKPI